MVPNQFIIVGRSVGLALSMREKSFLKVLQSSTAYYEKSNRFWLAKCSRSLEL
jgi:hypothetical protein